MSKIQELVDKMDPQTAASEIAEVMKKLFSLLDEESRIEFVMNVTGDAGKDKVGGLVHL
ncbi:MAG: hypothetical protein PVI06_11105 [Desulfobacterales bacterium]|jgi:hypothetical protein